MQENLTEALRCSSNGYKVYAVYGIKDRKCLCEKDGKPISGCRPGKHPYGVVCPHGTKDATTDASKLKEWFRGPLANVGVAVDGFIVLDVEARGVPLLAAWEAEHGPLPKTPTVRSGSGGRHYWFRCSDSIKPAGTGIKWVDGAEILTTGGVIVPPSNHVSGGRYEWLTSPETPLADMPEWLVSQVAEYLTTEAVKKEKSSSGTAFDFGNLTVDTGLSFASLGRLPAGNRNEPVNRVIGSMLRHGYSPTQIMEAGERWAEEQEPPYCLKELNSKIADFARKEAVKVAEVRFEDAGDELTDTRSPLSALTGSAFGSSAASTAEENDDNTPPVEPENGLPEAAYYGLIGEMLRAVENAEGGGIVKRWAVQK